MSATDELLNLRDWIKNLLETEGFEITGSGYYFQDQVADISFKFNGKTYWISLIETNLN